MSVDETTREAKTRVCSWAVSQAPIRNVYERGVLSLLAVYADHEGRGACVPASMLANHLRCSLRQVQRTLRELEKQGLIRRGDQRIAAMFPPARPTVWDLVVPPADGGAE